MPKLHHKTLFCSREQTKGMNKQALRESVYHYCNNSLSHIKCTFFFCKANIYKRKNRIFAYLIPKN